MNDVGRRSEIVVDVVQDLLGRVGLDDGGDHSTEFAHRIFHSSCRRPLRPVLCRSFEAKTRNRICSSSFLLLSTTSIPHFRDGSSTGTIMASPALSTSSTVAPDRYAAAKSSANSRNSSAFRLILSSLIESLSPIPLFYFLLNQMYQLYQSIVSAVFATVSSRHRDRETVLRDRG